MLNLQLHPQTTYISIITPSNLHFFGDGSIFSHDGTEMRYDKVATDIMLLCDGTRDVKGIADELMSLYGWTGETAPIYEKVTTFIASQIELDNLIQSDVACGVMIATTGERGKQYPHRIVLETTTGCNLRCSHCFMSSQKNGKVIPSEICNMLLT